MTAAVKIHKAGPGVTVQDLGRPGHAGTGLSRGGACDRLALYEAAVLLGQPSPAALLEMAGYGGVFEATQEMRIALTGAPMRAKLDGATVQWGASHLVTAGQRLTVGAALSGKYGYLSFAGGIATPLVLDSRAAHLSAGLGRALQVGDDIPVNPDPDASAACQALALDDRFSGGEIRIIEGPQTALYNHKMLQTFVSTDFSSSVKSNRQGARLEHSGAPFQATGQLNILSDLIVTGDIQMTGDGEPMVLLAECQTIGGYPRIGTVIPEDLPKVAQAAPGAKLRFRFVGLEEADSANRTPAQIMQTMGAGLTPIHRDPHDIHDLLTYQLIGGVTRGDDLEG